MACLLLGCWQSRHDTPSLSTQSPVTVGPGGPGPAEGGESGLPEHPGPNKTFSSSVTMPFNTIAQTAVLSLWLPPRTSRTKHLALINA